MYIMEIGIIICIVCMAFVVYLSWEDEFTKDDGDDDGDDDSDSDLPNL